MTPQELLLSGREILDPVFMPHGYQFELIEVGLSSGGQFAVGAYVNGEWAVDLHVRRTVGIVNYRLGATELEHRDYMRFLGVHQEAVYPGFSDDPLDAFRHLRADLERFGGSFLRREDAEVFQVFTRRLREEPHLFRRLP